MHPSASPLGYYRLGRSDGVSFFGKVVAARDQDRHASAARLADAAVRAGVRALSLVAGPVPLDTNHSLFLWPWKDEKFANGSAGELRALGAALAQLHEFFRSDPAAHGSTEPSWSERWLSIEALGRSQQLEGRPAQQLDRFLSRRDEVQARLTLAAHTLHDDLHPGNVLFGPDGDVMALLDFEEALHSHGSAWIDLAWVVERFCLLGPAPARAEFLASCFLESYALGGPAPRGGEGVLEDAILWRNYRALGVLAVQAEPATQARRAEWRKFCQILDALDDWRPMLTRLDSGIKIG